MICIDASVAAKWVFEEEYSQQAVALVDDCRKTRQRLVAPALLPIEVSNVIRQRMSRDGLSLADAEAALERFLAFSVAVRPNAPREQEALYLRALHLAVAHDLPAVYGSQYLALAETLGCTLWTDDRRLLRLLAHKVDYLKWIADYPLVDAGPTA
jgi:predicted nucleic acid-binding protein